MRIDRLSSYILTVVPKMVYLAHYQLTHAKTVSVYSPIHYFYPLVTFLSKHTLTCVDQLVDICVTDHPTFLKRFGLNYVFLSTALDYRVIITSFLDENSSLPSLTKLFSSSIWLEREVWDMFGIVFVGHPDLRRLLTDYGFDGFPLRKDFPLSGYIELRYDDEKMHIIYEPVEFTQNFRYFNSLSPWELTLV